MSASVRQFALSILLALIAVVGPLVAYAGVNVIWPESTHTASINTNPPVIFLQGPDYQKAVDAGWIVESPFEGHNNNASFEVTIRGLSGGTVVIDQYAKADQTDPVWWKNRYQLELSTEYTGGIVPPPHMHQDPTLASHLSTTRLLQSSP